MQKLTKIFLAVLFLCAIYYPFSVSYAAIPHLINYQGRLTDKDGAPLNGSYELTFRIYDAESAGNLLWQATHTGIVIQKGIFSILLGSANDSGYDFAALAFDKPYFLEIKVGSEVMSPRQRIASSAYAIRAEEAEKLGGKQPNDYALAADITSTPVANKAVKLDSNAKLPLSALKVYDSGWFAVSNNTSYTKTHSLGTTKSIILIYFSDTSDGSGKVGNAFDCNTYGTLYGIFMTSLTSTTINLRTGDEYVYIGKNSDGSVWYGASGYLKIIIMALE